jgi:hypothetical protein
MTYAHERLRSGDRVKVSFEGELMGVEDGVGASEGRVFLRVNDGDSDILFGYYPQNSEPKIEITAMTYHPGDVAIVHIGGGVELLMFRVDSKAEGAYWMQPTGRKWFDHFAPGNVQILHRAEALVKEAP